MISKTYIMTVVGTACLGFLISGIVPDLTQPTSSTPLTQKIAYTASSDMIAIPTPSFLESVSPTPDMEKIKSYKEKVTMLLDRLDTISPNRPTHAPSITGTELADADIVAISDSGAPTTSIIAPTTSPSIIPLRQNDPISIGDMRQNPEDGIIRIALLGDSMTETLGSNLPDLRALMESAYPNKTFALFNYGQGATNLDQGCARLTETTTYLQTEYPPILSYHPDILVLESFAYNHWSSSSQDLDRQWMTLAHCIDTIKKESPNTKIILATTIAPNIYTVGDGKLNWSASVKSEWTKTTKAYLQNMIRFSSSEKYPLADAYTPSLDSKGNGKAVYIDPSDHLHPSTEGKRFYSKSIADTIHLQNMIKK